MASQSGEEPSRDMRLKDLQLTTELLIEAVANERGARERIADLHEIQKSVITDRVGRIEQFFGVALFGGPQRKRPTAAGVLMAEYGPRLLAEIDHFTAMLQEARDRSAISLINSPSRDEKA